MGILGPQSFLEAYTNIGDLEKKTVFNLGEENYQIKVETFN